MMRSHAVKFEELFPVSRDNTEIQELLNLHDTKDLNNLSLLGMQRFNHQVIRR